MLFLLSISNLSYANQLFPKTPTCPVPAETMHAKDLYVTTGPHASLTLIDKYNQKWIVIIQNGAPVNYTLVRLNTIINQNTIHRTPFPNGEGWRCNYDGRFEGVIFYAVTSYA